MANSEFGVKIALTCVLISCINGKSVPENQNVKISTISNRTATDLNIHEHNQYHNYVITPHIQNTFKKSITKMHQHKKLVSIKNTKNKSSVTSSSGLLLYMLTVIIAVTLLVMLLCFVDKWRNNEGADGRYPEVQYSMLRQGEEEPEDPMAEILVNIGLVSSEDLRNISDTESEDSTLSNLESTEIMENIKNEFTTIPLGPDETHQLLQTRIEDSDEELIQ